MNIHLNINLDTFLSDLKISLEHFQDENRDIFIRMIKFFSVLEKKKYNKAIEKYEILANRSIEDFTNDELNCISLILDLVNYFKTQNLGEKGVDLYSKYVLCRNKQDSITEIISNYSLIKKVMKYPKIEISLDTKDICNFNYIGFSFENCIWRD